MPPLPPIHIPALLSPAQSPHLPWPRFELGSLVASPAALNLLDQSDTSVIDIIRRHGELDPGALSASDVRANTDALMSGARVMSSFTVTVAGQSHTVWVITDAVGDNGHRASTCVLLPGDY